MSNPRVLIYLLRRDLRVSDNPILHEISQRFASQQKTPAPFTHLLPLYVFPAQQIEVSGFLDPSKHAKSPYPEARSQVGGFWRCGHRRARFIAESAWDVKEHLEKLQSGLEIRVGMVGGVIGDMMKAFEEKQVEVVGVWMTSEEGVEEKREEKDVKKVVERHGKQFKLFKDEKYFVDDRDLPFEHAKDLPDVFTSFRKTVEPLRSAPRSVLPPLSKKSLPPLPPSIPPQSSPFTIPSTLDKLISALHSPLSPTLDLDRPPTWSEHEPSLTTAHPFHGGESEAQARVTHLITSGAMSSYKATRNGLLGSDFSTKLSAWLALGCITARQVHRSLLDFEDGATDVGSNQSGYGKGENEGTKAVRFELLWRDYMRLCTRKFGPALFQASGFRGVTEKGYSWRPRSSSQETLLRVLNGTSGTSLVDASFRELYLTGYTSNRARQNAASFLSKHLGLDWRLGAEWYECALVDYDVSSNWGNWQYVAGVGNDPRGGGEGRMFNPVKQGIDYDGKGEYVKAWVGELSGLSDVRQMLSPWSVPEDKRDDVLKGYIGCEKPLVRIEWRGGHGGGGSHNNNKRRNDKGRSNKGKHGKRNQN